MTEYIVMTGYIYESASTVSCIVITYGSRAENPWGKCYTEPTTPTKSCSNYVYIHSCMYADMYIIKVVHVTVVTFQDLR